MLKVYVVCIASTMLKVYAVNLSKKVLTFKASVTKTSCADKHVVADKLCVTVFILFVGSYPYLAAYSHDLCRLARGERAGDLFVKHVR